MKKNIITFLTCIFLFEYVNAQVNVQDSLILVNIYYALDGPNWQNQRNFLTAPVKIWQGVGLTSDSTRVNTFTLGGSDVSGYIHPSIGDLSELVALRITNSNLSGSTIPHTIGRLSKLRILQLHNNQLEGQLPDSICNLTALEQISLWQNNLNGAIPACVSSFPLVSHLTIQFNQFEGLPDLSNAPYWFYLTIQNNRFTFEDIEPNWLRFFDDIYAYAVCAPQFDSVNAIIDTTVVDNSVFEMRCSIGGQYNVYQWTKDGVDIPYATDSIYVLNNVALSDSGVYACRITNTLVTILTYYRRPITLRVDKTTTTPTSSKAIVNEMLLYPSPAYDYLNIAVKLKDTEHATIELFDIYGNKINTIANATFKESVINLHVGNLAKGTYIISLKSNNFATSQRFLIIR